MVPTNAGGGRGADEEWRSQSGGGNEEGDSGQDSWSPGRFGQAVGVRIRCRQGWHRYKMGRKQLVGITGQKVQADGGREVLVEGQEAWEDWLKKTVEDTGWREEAKGEGASSSEKWVEE